LAASKSNTIDSLVKHNNVELAELNKKFRQTAKSKGPERGLFGDFFNCILTDRELRP